MTYRTGLGVVMVCAACGDAIRPFARRAGQLSITTVVAADAASMVDIGLMSRLVSAVPSTARLILLGDKDQLTSVEAGAVLGDVFEAARSTGYSPHFSKTVRDVSGDQIPEVEDGATADFTIYIGGAYAFGRKVPAIMYGVGSRF